MLQSLSKLLKLNTEFRDVFMSLKTQNSHFTNHPSPFHFGTKTFLMLDKSWQCSFDPNVMKLVLRHQNISMSRWLKSKNQRYESYVGHSGYHFSSNKTIFLAPYYKHVGSISLVKKSFWSPSIPWKSTYLHLDDSYHCSVWFDLKKGPFPGLCVL